MVAIMRQPFVALSVVTTLLAFNQYTLAQRVDCPLPNVTVLETQLESLFRESDSPSTPTIRIDGNVTYVCLHSGMFKDTYRGLSFVARYQCTGSQDCPSNSVEESQFDLSCTSLGTWTTAVSGTSEFSFTRNPVANMTTPLRTDCRLCINPLLLEAIGEDVESDVVTHCVACPASCDMGARRCFGNQAEDCCHFYDPANDKCLTQCPSDRIVTDDFDCAAFAGFSRPQYVFAEEDGTGSVMIEGTPGVEVRVRGGPNTNMRNVRFSGTDVDEIVTVPAVGPATVTFNITDDTVTGEDDETYPLNMVATDTTVVIQQRFTTIIITDNVDIIQVGFFSMEYPRIEGIVTPVDVNVFGETVTDLEFIYTQAGQPSREGLIMAGFYALPDRVFLPIVNPDDEIALEDNMTVEFSLQPVPEFQSDIEFGAVIGNEQTFQTTNLIIIDDDIVTVSFVPPSFDVLENESAVVTLSLDRGIATAFSVIVQPIPASSLLPGLVPSIPTTTYRVSFDVNNNTQSRTFLFEPIDDLVPREPVEPVQLIFSLISDSRVRQGPPADVNILDNDELADIIVGFENSEYIISEGEMDGFVTIIRDQFDASFTVEVTAETPGGDFIVQSANASRLSGLVDFEVGEENVSYPLDIQDDDVALEDTEVFTLRLGSPSDSRVRIGGSSGGVQYFASTRINIVDDDLVRVGFVQDTPYQFQENESPTILVGIFTEIVAGRRAIITATEEDIGDTEFVQESFLLGAVDLIFDDNPNPIQLFPLIEDDNVGLEDPETSTLVLRPGGTTDPAKVIINPARVDIIVLDNEVVTLRIDGSSTRTIFEGSSTDVCVTKDIATVRIANFSLTPIDGTATDQDYTPSSVQSGALSVNAMARECFTFFAILDSLDEVNEAFSVTLTSTDAGRAIVVEDDTVVITIVEVPTPTVGDVEDTVIGDPLFTVPIPVGEHLCYEIRGASNQYFNFISDSCVSVNAHYVEHALAGESKPLHVIDQIAIRAVDTSNTSCINILVDRNGCTASVDNTPTTAYSQNGVIVAASNSRVVVNVPNCRDMDLEMEIICENMNGVDMLRFEVTRGLNLRESSHGLLGQFWNVLVAVERYNGTLRGDPDSSVVIVTLAPTDRAMRRFPAWQEKKTWDNRRTCLYAGNQNGGTVYEVAEAHDSLIEGRYTDYIIRDGPFSTAFEYSQFQRTC